MYVVDSLGGVLVSSALVKLVGGFLCQLQYLNGAACQLARKKNESSFAQ